MMVEMSQLFGASTNPCGWVGPVMGGEDKNGVSQHTVSCGPCKDQILAFAVTLKPIRKHISQENALYWYSLCYDRFNMLGENPFEEMMCSNPI